MEETKGKKKVDIPKSISDAVNAVAKVIGVAATELWSIFVQQYVVKGLQQAFTGTVLCIAAFFLYGSIGLWILIPLGVALIFFYSAIATLGNPKYYALEDISNRVQEFRDQEDNKKSSRYY
jgi:hypothetical protein